MKKQSKDLKDVGKVVFLAVVFLLWFVVVAYADTRGGERGDGADARFEAMALREEAAENPTPTPPVDTEGGEGENGGEPGESGSTDGTSETTTGEEDENTTEEIEDAFEENGVSEEGFMNVFSALDGDVFSVIGTVLTRMRN